MFAVTGTDPTLVGNTPWLLQATTQGTHEFFVNPDHTIFQSATMTPLDGLLAELAWSAMDFSRGTLPRLTYGKVLAGLRDKYGGVNKLDAASLASEAAGTLTAIARSLPRSVGKDDSRALFMELTPAEQEAVLQAMAVRAAPNPQRAMEDGRFLEYAPKKTLLRFFEAPPELFFDGRYWDSPYASLDFSSASATDEARTLLTKYYGSLLNDARWLAEQEPTSLAAASRSRLLRASLALDLLQPTSFEAEQS